MTRTDERVPINYRYEGDLNIEQITVHEQESETPADFIKKYIQGIHFSHISKLLTVKSPHILLTSVDAVDSDWYSGRYKTSSPRSKIELERNVVIFSTFDQTTSRTSTIQLEQKSLAIEVPIVDIHGKLKTKSSASFSRNVSIGANGTLSVKQLDVKLLKGEDIQCNGRFIIS